MLLVVLAIIAFVALRNAQTVAPAALEVQKHNQARSQQNVDGTAPAPPAPANGDAWTESPPSRPNLQTMDQNTTQHSDAVQSALSQPN